MSELSFTQPGPVFWAVVVVFDVEHSTQRQGFLVYRASFAPEVEPAQVAKLRIGHRRAKIITHFAYSAKLRCFDDKLILSIYGKDSTQQTTEAWGFNFNERPRQRFGFGGFNRRIDSAEKGLCATFRLQTALKNPTEILGQQAVRNALPFMNGLLNTYTR